MSELIDIIISAVDEASATFESIVGSAEDAQSSLEGMSDSAESIPTTAIEETAQAVDDVEQEANETATALDNINNIITGMASVEVFSSIADTLMDCADKAGNFQDSITRASLAAEGAGISTNQMTDTVSKLSSETGRAGGQIREAFINATSAGITSTESFTKMMEGASAQAFIMGTDVEGLASKLSGMTMKSSIAEKTLKGTGITVADLGEAMGMQGATIDEINDKWETMDSNQRAAILGTAASMNEGEKANDAYKNSWEGLHNQIDIAKGRIERLVGSVLLPVLIPAMRAAANALNWLGDIVQGVMDGPLGGLVSAIGAVAAGIALAVPAIAAIQAGMALFTASIWPAVTASWALLAPWLPFIAIGAAVVLVIYEIGKAFGWWNDASSMIDAISAGLQRLWNAFINHPDVQAFLEAMGQAWGYLTEIIGEVGQAVLDFFGINESGNFDVVSALINGIGNAWNTVRPAIMFVINTWIQLINTINQFRNGQIDLPTFIFNILTTMANAYMTIFNTIIGYVAMFAAQLLQRGISAATNFVNNIINRIRQLPGKIYSALIAAVSKISSAGAKWVSTARSKASSVVTNVYNTLAGLPGKIASALSGVASAIAKPFQDAYNRVANEVNKIKNKANELSGGLLAWGGDDYVPAGSMAGVDLSQNSNITTTAGVDHNLTGELTLVHDLRNLPDSINEATVARLINETVSSDDFAKNLARNMSFQEYDLSIKQKIVAKTNRARGV